MRLIHRCSRYLAAFLVLATTGCAPAARAPLQGQAPTGPPSPLEAVVDSIMATPPLHRAHWGIQVTDSAGRVLFERNAERLFVAASNVKVATIAAALGLLGPEYRWTTGIETRGVRDGVASGVVVRGSGDPTFSDHFHDHALAPLDSLADSLAHAGIRRIDGPVVIDLSRFDSVLVHPAWETFDLDWYYAAPVAPLAVMEGAIPVVMTPTRPGAPARVELLVPEGLVHMDAAVMTVEGDRRWDDDLRRIPGTDSVVFRGRIGAAAGPDTSWIAQDQPGRLAGRALIMALERRGIEVDGPLVLARAEGLPPLPGEQGPSVTWRSAPLSAVARIALEQSDNWVTEQVLKTLGAERGAGGTWSAGTTVVEDFLTGPAGVPAGAVYLRDGSGLSAQNLLTPAALTQILRFADDQPWSEIFRDAMVSPGEPESTLEKRLLRYAGRVTAKTGTIRHVTVLSGYAESDGGAPLVFSVMSNASGQPASQMQAAIDRIVEVILRNGS